MPDAKHSNVYFGGPDTDAIRVHAPPEIVVDNLQQARSSGVLCKLLIGRGEPVEVHVNPDRVTYVEPAIEYRSASF